MANLPAGFVLDSPQQLPPDFQLDQPQQENSGLLASTGKLALEAGKNLPGSTLNLLNNIGLALMHPVDTAQALGEVAFGGVEKLIPGEQKHEQKFNQIADFYKQRYGSKEGLNKAIATDPAGVMADMSALLTGLGGASRVAGSLADVPALSSAGSALSKAGAATDPLNLAATGAAKVAGGAPAEAIYASASKMGTTKGIPERRAAVNTALENELMPTEAGLKVLEGKKQALYEQLNSAIDTATESGQTIKRDKLLMHLRDAVNTAVTGPNSSTVKKQIYNMVDQLRSEWPKNITPRNVQDIKVSFQRAVKESNYGQMTPGTKDAQKQIARAARQILEDRISDVGAINKNLAEYKNLERELERAAARISNRDPLGMTKMLLTGFGGATGGVEGMAAGLGLGVLLDPRVQSKLAILLRRTQNKGLNRNLPAYVAREGLRQVGQSEQNQ